MEFHVAFMFVCLMASITAINGEWRQKTNQDCWTPCNNKGGACPSFCGSDGFCCRDGWGGCPDGAGKASPSKHTCVTQRAKRCWGGNNCCTNLNPCYEGEGDCDENSNCHGDLVCLPYSCRGRSFQYSDDCCVIPDTVGKVHNTIRNINKAVGIPETNININTVVEGVQDFFGDLVSDLFGRKVK